MSSRLRWGIGTLLVYAAIQWLLYGVPALRQPDDTVWRIAHGFAYAACGVVLLGALARGLPQAGAHVWRVTTLLLGALAAGAGLWAAHQPMQAPATLDAWMAALLGVALAVVLPRWLPDAAARRWLGVDRHQSLRADR